MLIGSCWTRCPIDLKNWEEISQILTLWCYYNFCKQTFISLSKHILLFMAVKAAEAAAWCVNSTKQYGSPPPGSRIILQPLTGPIWPKSARISSSDTEGCKLPTYKVLVPSPSIISYLWKENHISRSIIFDKFKDDLWGISSSNHHSFSKFWSNYLTTILPVKQKNFTAKVIVLGIVFTYIVSMKTSIK